MKPKLHFTNGGWLVFEDEHGHGVSCNIRYVRSVHRLASPVTL